MKVAGHDTLLVVDTGAQSHVLSSAVAVAANLVTFDSGINGADWRGQPMKMWRTDHPDITLEGLGTVIDQPSAITEFTEGFRARGLGGTLSPQWLATGRVDVVIDFPSSRLSVRERGAPPVDPSGIALGAPDPVCLDRSGGLVARSLAVNVLIGGVPARLAIDTGAENTLLFTTSAAASALTRAGGSSGPGREAGERTFSAVAISAGDWSTTASVVVTEGASNRACPYDGRLGIDVLRTCVLTITEHDSAVRCPRGS